MNARYILRLASAFLSRFRFIIILAIVLGVGLFFGIRFLIPSISGKTVQRIGLSGRYYANNLPISILEMAGDGLTKINPDGSVEPKLATSWETPDKGKTWIFHLNKKIFWQDGKQLASKDINYQFSDVEIQRPDDLTITFVLQNSYSAFPAVVSKPTFKKGLLGTGQWQVKNISLSGSYVQKLILENKQGEKRIYKFYPTEEQLKLAYQLGEVDQIKNLIDPTPINNWKTASTQKEIQKDKYVAVFFNTQDKNLSDKSIRQALSYAINKSNLGESRAIGPLSPDSWAHNPQVKPYEYDPIRARELINVLPDEVKRNLQIDLSTSPILLSQADKIAKNWQEIGVKTNVKVTSGVPDDFQALLAIFDIPKDPDQYSVWHSTQTTTNITNYQNPRIDKLLEDGRTTLNFEDRRKIYLDFQRFLVEDAPAAFLYHPAFYTIVRK